MKNFDAQIKELAKQEKQEPIFDGIVNEKEYNAANKKILWILKEANSTGEEGSWDMRKHIDERLNTGKGILKGWSGTFKKIVYVTNGLLNNLEWNDNLRHPSSDPNVINELKKMAYINVKKTGGSSRTDSNMLREHYNKNKTLLFEQIKEFKPDILIFGGTFKYFKEDLDVSQMNNYGSCKATNINGQIYIDAYHPQYTIKEETYFNDIINAVKSESK